MNALQKEDIYTDDDIYGLPEGERAELIDGKIYYMASPGRNHQKILGAVYRKIADYIDANNGECEVYMAPFAVFLNDPPKHLIHIISFAPVLSATFNIDCCCTMSYSPPFFF